MIVGIWTKGQGPGHIAETISKVVLIRTRWFDKSSCMPHLYSSIDGGDDCPKQDQ